MKSNNNTILTVAAVAIGVLLLRKRQQATAGVGNVFKDISNLQKFGIDFRDNWEHLSYQQKSWVSNYAEKVAHFRQTKTQIKKEEPLGKSFYRYLRPTYNKIVAVSGVGSSFLDSYSATFTEYPIFNDKGQIVVQYNDQNDFPALKEFKDELEYHCNQAQNVNDISTAYWGTILYIAEGGKFIWKEIRTYEGTRVAFGLKEQLFGGRSGSETERKARISYLARSEKGGRTIDNLAEQWSAGDGGDYFAAKEGIMDAVRNVQSVSEAKELLRAQAITRIAQQRDDLHDTYNSENPFPEDYLPDDPINQEESDAPF